MALNYLEVFLNEKKKKIILSCSRKEKIDFVLHKKTELKL